MRFQIGDLLPVRCVIQTEAWGRTFKSGDEIEVLLEQDWDGEEVLGGGGPWGWGGYTTESLEAVAERISDGRGITVYMRPEQD